MEKKFVIKAETIEKVVNRYNAIWNYHYKEYLFNDKYPDAYAVCIPQGCFGIKAILMGHIGGIIGEFTEVEIEDGEKRTVIFDMDHQVEEALRVDVLKLTKENKALREELTKAQMKLKAITEIAHVA
jgi:hypothetical protein